ncbi:hypothetical protein [Nocardia rhizosphaerae]|uniref:PPE family protein n=1 Tax=Nocardia rhizosphaerae TaxID=1691571 RepID=A0ABV8KYT0_9NOCA
MSYPNIAGLDLFGRLRDFVTPGKDHSELDSSDIADIQDEYNDQRAGARRAASELGFDGEYRAKMVTTTDPFTGTVAELRAKVDKIDLTAVNDLIAAWNEIATRNSTSLDEFRKQITRGMSPEVWSGAAASAAAQTVAAYDATGQRVSTAAALTRAKLDELRTGLEPTKRLVPFEPEHRSGLENLGGLFTGRTWRNDDVAQENARVEAVRVLETVYAPVIHESDDRVPVIPVPKAVDDGGDPGVTNGSTGPGVNSNPVSSDPGGPAATTPAATTPAEDDTAGDESPITDDSTTETSASEDTASEGSTTPQSTDPTATAPASTAPTSAGPGAGSPAGAPGGSGGPGSGGPGAGAPASGSSVPGGGSAPGTAAGGARTSAAAGGAAGRAAGMAGMGAPGARGAGKDDETTRGVPDYLVTKEHGDELTGLDTMPKLVPPVIGAD